MTKGRLQVVARIVARQEKVNDVQAILTGLVAPTRAEAGCLSYELLQNHDDPTDFTFVEEWTGDDTLDAHLLTPHVAAALAQVVGLLATAPDIRRYQLLA